MVFRHGSTSRLFWLLELCVLLIFISVDTCSLRVSTADILTGLRLVRAQHTHNGKDVQHGQVWTSAVPDISRPEDVHLRSIRSAASPSRADGAPAHYVRSALTPSTPTAKESRRTAQDSAASPDEGHTMNESQSDDDIVGFLLSTKGLPPLRTPWNPGIFYDVPLNTSRFPNTVPHSYPSAQQVRTFLGKIQGIHLYVAGPWQEQRQSVLAAGYAPPAVPTLFRNFTAEAFETWRSEVGSLALIKEMYMEPVRGLLIDNIIKQDRIFYNLFNWYRELFPLEMIASWSVLP